MQEIARTNCPFLGSWRDPETAYGYPTSRNACAAGPVPQEVSKSQQQERCLTCNFVQCEAFQARTSTDAS